MKEINQTMLMDRKIPHCQDISSSPLSLQIQCNLNQNPNKLFSRYQQTDSEVYTEGQRTQNSQHDIEGEDKCQRNDTT